MTDNVPAPQADAVIIGGGIMGCAIAYNLGLPFVPIRKKGKLPGQTIVEDEAARYEKIDGTWDEREAKAKAAVSRLRAEPFPGRWTLPPEFHPVLAGTP